VTDSEARHLVEDLLLDEREFWPNWPIPSTALSEPSFDGKDGFRRGPVWIAPNWFVYRGLLRYGYKDVAKELARKTRKLIESNGFREHYNPDTGEGIGAHDFTWGGLILDME
jgi:glycogen debranching enzyme